MKKVEKKRLRRIFFCLYAISALILIAGINRLWRSELLRTPVLDVLRVCDLNVMFIFAPLCVIWLAFLLYFYRGHRNPFTLLIFIIGTYMLGAGFGTHEPFNIVRSVYAQEMTENIMRTAGFMDDGLGHWTFFAGFVLLSLSIVIAELRNPFSEKIPAFNITVSTVLGLITGFVIYMNMAWEKTAFDLAVIACCLALVFLFKLRYGNPQFSRIPMTYTLCVSYGLGLCATLIHWFVR